MQMHTCEPSYDKLQLPAIHNLEAHTAITEQSLSDTCIGSLPKLGTGHLHCRCLLTVAGRGWGIPELIWQAALHPFTPLSWYRTQHFMPLAILQVEWCAAEQPVALAAPGQGQTTSKMVFDLLCCAAGTATRC